MPMTCETSTQARFLVPIAISIGFGILNLLSGERLEVQFASKTFNMCSHSLTQLANLWQAGQRCCACSLFL